MSQLISSNELENNLLLGWSILNTVITTTGTPSVLATSTDLSGILSPGDKLWIVQSTNKYVYVLSVTTTTVTVSQSSNYTIVGTGVTPISATYFSKATSPFGFPPVFSYAPNLTGFSAAPSSAFYRFTMVGKMVTVFIAMPNNGTSNGTSFVIDLPVPAATITGMQWAAPLLQTVNNGSVNVSNPGIALISSAATTMTLLSDLSGSLWVSSGGKRVPVFSITYEAG